MGRQIQKAQRKLGTLKVGFFFGTQLLIIKPIMLFEFIQTSLHFLLLCQQLLRVLQLGYWEIYQLLKFLHILPQLRADDIGQRKSSLVIVLLDIHGSWGSQVVINCCIYRVTLNVITSAGWSAKPFAVFSWVLVELEQCNLSWFGMMFCFDV